MLLWPRRNEADLVEATPERTLRSGLRVNFPGTEKQPTPYLPLQGCAVTMCCNKAQINMDVCPCPSLHLCRQRFHPPLSSGVGQTFFQYTEGKCTQSENIFNLFQSRESGGLEQRPVSSPLSGGQSAPPRQGQQCCDLGHGKGQADRQYGGAAPTLATVQAAAVP